MSRQKQNGGRADLDRARDELFSHIHRCGVLAAEEEHQIEWLEDTIEYMSERYPRLGPEALEELKQIGLRFCRPVISRPTEPPAEATQDGADAGSEAAAA